MSFSSQVKMELSQINNLAKKDQVDRELAVYLITGNAGKNNKKMTSITSIMGNLFFKSKNMGEDMYMAMECRGFTGEYVSYGKFKFTAIDAVYILIIAILIALFFIL